MIAVLIDSRRKGTSGKIAVRSASRLRATGLDGDEVKVELFDGQQSLGTVMFREDEIISFDESLNLMFVQAEHMVVGRGRVNLDLLR